MKVTNREEEFEEFKTFVSLISGGLYLLVSFSIDMGRMMVVVVLSFAPPFCLSKSLWIVKNGWFSNFFLRNFEILSLTPQPFKKQSTVFVNFSSNFVF